MKLSTKFLGTVPLPSEGQMCLLKQNFKGGFLTFKNITHNLFFPFQKLLYRMKDCAKERSNLGGKCWSLDTSCFFRSFFDPQSPVLIMCCSIYILSVFCACQGGPKTRWLSIVLIHCHPLTSRLFFFLF